MVGKQLQLFIQALVIHLAIDYKYNILTQLSNLAHLSQETLDVLLNK